MGTTLLFTLCCRKFTLHRQYSEKPHNPLMEAVLRCCVSVQIQAWLSLIFKLPDCVTTNLKDYKLYSKHLNATLLGYFHPSSSSHSQHHQSDDGWWCLIVSFPGHFHLLTCHTCTQCLTVYTVHMCNCAACLHPSPPLTHELHTQCREILTEQLGFIRLGFMAVIEVPLLQGQHCKSCTFKQQEK